MAPLKTALASVATADPRVLQKAEVGSLSDVSHSDLELGRGDILLEVIEAPRPASLLFRGEPLLSGWAAVANVRSVFEEEMRAAGWIFFFMAGEIKASVLGFDQSKTLRRAVARLAGRAKAQKCNALEIAQITCSRFLGVSRVSISAHVRHLQKGSVFFGK
jgi:hypothetical protein